MEVKTLTIDQTAVAKAEIGLIKSFVSTLDHPLSSQRDELIQTLSRLELAESLMLKTVDSAFTSFLAKCMTPLKLADQRARAVFVKNLETSFQTQRETPAGHQLLDLILLPILSAYNPKEVWVPGCGEAYEAAWIDHRFTKAECIYLDIDDEALEKARHRIANLNISAKVLSSDLTKPEALPEGRPDLVLFFNPFVIDDAEYQRLLSVLSDRKISDAKANSYLCSLSMSGQSQKIFDNILDRMETKHFFSITMDLAEAHAIYNFFQSRNIQVTCYRNPYAIKNLASHILGKSYPRIEPKIYHYVLVASAS